MANPAPTINQINAFNATQGTIIDFNIIGGTELVRSNRIYIYDLSDNSLICTHLYVSTESIHELPANTDSSIVYESGKSSADFVNGAQYYAQIQTFTDTAGSEGGSGLSVAKMFWCLVDPTLTITTIPSTISTTSYNVSATYNANTSVVSNIIQQYQFSLYSATGSLLQSSGVVVGSGTQQGTSTAYDISYNFTGLSVGSSYYVVVDVTTTQGMNVSTQSNTFTVSIETPTLGEATVVNNACDGYISVTSNLSGEYGGSASGEIASFVTDSVNDVSSLKVNLEPIQDLHGYDRPWVGGAGDNIMPYPIEREVTFSGVTFKSDGKGNITYTGTCNGDNYAVISVPEFTIPSGTSHKVAFLNSQAVGQMAFTYNSAIVDSWNLNAVNKVSTYSGMSNKQCNGVRVNIVNGVTYNQSLSIMFVPTSTEVSGYIPYENICPISGWDEVETHKAQRNLFNGEYDVLYKLPEPIAKGTWVTASAKGSASSRVVYYDENQNQIDYWSVQIQDPNDSERYYRTFQISQYSTKDAYYIKFILSEVSDMQFEIAESASSLPTPYEPVTTITTTLPTTVYGGTLDVVSGVLTVDRAMVTLDGSNTSPRFGEVSQAATADGTLYVAYINHPAFGMANNDIKTISDKYAFKDSPLSSLHVGEFNAWGGYTRFVLSDQSITSLSALNAYLADNPIQLVYELATPTSCSLTPQEVQTLTGRNNVWSDGSVSITYNIPITNLLVKRQDVADVSGTWLTLHSQPITQASDMDFTFIDFLNQYGKTYKYALVPLLTQTQSGVEVEVEGGHTVSDEVQSIFDGVFIADSTGLQKCKANVGYGDVDMNQDVGTITPIGAKYPVVVTNSKNQYHNGSISGTIVPDDYYFNGNLSRIDMVNKRNELEQFLTNKRAKIIKDWNSNIWLVMIIDNINCSFDNNYGMGMVNFNASWIEVGDPTNQQDLQAAGLIDVGGV